MKNKRPGLLSLILWSLFALILLLSIYCAGNSGKHKEPGSSDSASAVNSETLISQGERLALNYCQRCHLFVQPSLLDKKTWTNSVLPNMGWRLGVRENGTDPYADLLPEESKIIRQANIYPESPTIAETDWKAIKEYYETAAPSEPLPQENKFDSPSTLTGFEPKLIKFDDKALPQTTLLKYDKRRGQLYVGDAQNDLYILDKKLRISDSWQIESPATDIDFPRNGSPRLLTIGVFSPSDQKLGRLASLDTAKVLPENGVFIEALPRPVQFATADLNMDGHEDVVICGFGNHTGKLSWYDGMNPSKEHILKSLPGARCAVIQDLNNDNKPDITVLMSQSYEQVSIFYNEGNGAFSEKKVLDFPPVFGVSYFEMIDFNKDGFQDILLVNGDNWDLSPINKNYHGIRLFLNDGEDNFKQSFFYPLYGASKALARDFDNDGDLDIAAISIFADQEKAELGFVLLSNEGAYHFKPLILPQAALGKWLTMEAGDFDRDGDIDLALGSYFQNIGELTKLIAKGATAIPQLLILVNKKE
jgi:hypothetical protein